EFWYRAHEARSAAAQAWSVRWPTTQPAFQWVNLSDVVKRQLSCDSGAQCNWGRLEDGYWQLVYFRWLPSRSLYARVRSQLNKTHRPEHCLIGSGMKLVRNLGVGVYQIGGQKFALHRFLFEADGRLLRVYYGQYEDSAPPDSVASYREGFSARIGAAMDGSRNYGLRILELAVAGIADDEQAEAAVRRQLAAVIDLEHGEAAPGK
ncbi:MAG: hypothetical protein NTZ16_15535, partial [Verrucomicrobia bacterium]|nr:hypothetical protein [Verrucomicrobiota bacterium]